MGTKEKILNIDVLLLYVGSRKGQYNFCCRIDIIYFLLYWSTISYYDSAFSQDKGNKIWALNHVCGISIMSLFSKKRISFCEDKA
jgi:hypothetical protein